MLYFGYGSVYGGGYLVGESGAQGFDLSGLAADYDGSLGQHPDRSGHH